eukprot:scaffold4386_cov143-Pinguiococcus_pyrenoidosus.AAC.1
MLDLPYQVHKINVPSPPLVYEEHEVDEEIERNVGDRLAASYINFYLCNGGVVVPQFGVEPWDSEAIEKLQ